MKVVKNGKQVCVVASSICHKTFLMSLLFRIRWNWMSFLSGRKWWVKWESLMGILRVGMSHEVDRPNNKWTSINYYLISHLYPAQFARIVCIKNSCWLIFISYLIIQCLTFIHYDVINKFQVFKSSCLDRGTSL